MSRTNLWIHFVHLFVILEGGNCPHTYYPNCNMFVTWLNINKRHPGTALHTKGEKRNRRRMEEE